MFQDYDVNLPVLRERAYNLRWATLPQDVIPLTAADPDFPCAPQITEAISQHISSGYMSYGPPEGLPAFRNEMANFFRVHRNITITAESVFPVDSAASGIYITCRALLSPGDEAIIFDPVDFLFRYSVEAVGAVAVPYATPPGTENVFHGIESHINAHTRMICLCNPLNPTGKVFTKQELQQLAEIALRHNLYILSDEIWSDIIFSGHSFTSIASLGHDISMRTITVTGFSKSYGLAGLRIGALAATNPNIYAKLLAASLHQSTIHGANILGQVAATAALANAQPWLQQFLQHLQRMRDLCVQQLNAMPGISCIAPEGCYVAFANITQTGLTSQQMTDRLMQRAKVAVVPGLKQWFGDGAEGYIRLSFATSHGILSQALERIGNELAQ